MEKPCYSVEMLPVVQAVTVGVCPTTCTVPHSSSVQQFGSLLPWKEVEKVMSDSPRWGAAGGGDNVQQGSTNKNHCLPGDSLPASDHQHCRQQWLAPALGHTLRHSSPLHATAPGGGMPTIALCHLHPSCWVLLLDSVPLTKHKGQCCSGCVIHTAGSERQHRSTEWVDYMALNLQGYMALREGCTKR